ncbi:MAG: hypothetical protein OJJ21_14130 [Ferrovibrio sp.]|uniref:DUF6634 family protein n=1 Tax=Ferrovibrio sp. TaxID=1917215 RepID=UPI002621F7CA|nr:DUF6634 family protein [Ferrovibrio sp.]MCW0234733.1 hypothetical protein [Ferrovibrio sp.]
MYRYTDEGLDRPTTNDIRKLRSLADDLERLLQWTAPTEADLTHAPELTDYWVDTRPMYCLKGVVKNHPRITSPMATTSDLWVFAPGLGWARTYSRWYRLKSPLEFPPRITFDIGGAP